MKMWRNLWKSGDRIYLPLTEFFDPEDTKDVHAFITDDFRDIQEYWQPDDDKNVVFVVIRKF